MANPARASLGRRLLALVYEILLLAAVLIAGFLVPQAILGAALQTTPPPAILKAHFLAVPAVYFVWFWTHGGQTLALKTWRLRIVTAGGAPLGPAQAMLRHVAAWLSIALLGLGFAWALFDREGQFLHDRLAGTRIVPA